jgi:hypothetical protein
MEKDHNGVMKLALALLAVSVLTFALISRPGGIYAADGPDISTTEHVSDNEDNGIERSQAADS